jgi:hypothetical protein
MRNEKGYRVSSPPQEPLSLEFQRRLDERSKEVGSKVLRRQSFQQIINTVYMVLVGVALIIGGVALHRYGKASQENHALLAGKLTDKDNEIARLNQSIKDLTAAKDAIIAEKDKQLVAKDAIIADKDHGLQVQTAIIQQLYNSIIKLQDQVRSLGGAPISAPITIPVGRAGQAISPGPAATPIAKPSPTPSFLNLQVQCPIICPPAK